MWLFNEDKAIKEKFSGLVVTDVNAPDAGRPVQVIWLDSDVELVNLTYPSIIIANTGISFDAERAHAGWAQLPYTPESFPDWISDANNNVSESPYWAFTPIPYNIDYQIEVLSRNNQHSTFLSAVLAGPDYLSTRHGYLVVEEDGTVRRLDLMTGPDRQNTHDTDGKRIFHTIYTVRVSTELLPSEISTYSKVTTVVDTIEVLPPQV
jgi:hypothetical protein